MQVVALGPLVPHRVVAVDDAGPVLVLVVAGARELEEGEGGRDQGDTDEEAFLQERDILVYAAPMNTRATRGIRTYAELLLRRARCAVRVAVVVGIVCPAALLSAV